MAKAGSYRAEQEDLLDQKLFALCGELPPYVAAYFSSRKGNATAKTRLSYAYDLDGFFRWLSTQPAFSSSAKRDITASQLASLGGGDIDAYIASLWAQGNHYAGVHRKYCALNTFFKYLVRKDYLLANPMDKAERVTKDANANSIHVIKLQPKEIPLLLDTVEGMGVSETVSRLSERQKKALARTRTRDLAIMTVLLGTGIRVSECAGLNLSDIDLENCIMEVDRKGDKRQRIALGDEVISALSAYLAEREEIKAVEHDADALFLSIQKRRMCVQSIEKTVHLYTTLIGTKEHITPHKLRKTYGTELYNETGDIFLVAQALGHADVNTTKRHYVEESTENLLRHRNAFQMRKKPKS